MKAERTAMTRRAALAIVSSLCLSIGSVRAIAQALSDWDKIDAPPALEWPRDHGAHPRFQTEWWYVTGEVEDGNRRAFGYQLTIFRRGLALDPPPAGASRLRASEILAGHLAIVDIAARDFRSRQRMRRSGAGLAGAEIGELRAWIEDWEMRRTPDGVIHLHALDGELALDLELTLEKPLVSHGEKGWSRKGPEPGNASAYVSATRLATRGTIRFGDAPIEVRGDSWFDHEWGSSQLSPDVVGWDWFGLRLDDGRELMLYRLRTRDGGVLEQSSGTIVAADGETTHLSRAAFTCTPTDTWTSPQSGAPYPIAWRIEVASPPLVLDVVARVPACEVDGRASTGVIYWEGPVSVKGSVSGGGYAELTGYGGPLPKEF